jgi:hypothetical protein
MVSLVQVSQYTIISAWNSMITPAVKWFVNRDIMTTNKLPATPIFLRIKRYIEPGKWSIMYLCVRGIKWMPLSTILIFDFGIECMVSLVQVSQYTIISAWNSMITPAVKWFVNRDIMTTNKLPGMYY